MGWRMSTSFWLIKTTTPECPCVRTTWSWKVFWFICTWEDGHSLESTHTNLRVVAHFSIQLDTVARGWPAYLTTVAATCLLIKQAEKLTFRQLLSVRILHQVINALEAKGQLWLTPGPITQCQAMLIDISEPCQTLNPTTLLPEFKELLVDKCTETLDMVYARKQDVRSEPLLNSEAIWFVDRSCFFHEGQWRTGEGWVCNCNNTRGHISKGVKAQPLCSKSWALWLSWEPLNWQKK